MSNLINKILLDQYRIDAFVESGGMGAVYRVWDMKRNVPLAMKVLHSDLADDPHMLKRFQREANALKKLTHPNIVQFYGLFQTLDFAFILERFVDGPSLKTILRQKKQLSVQEALVYLKALSAALGYAHANGVIHCDVKPGNVLVDQGGNIYLTDFGIARHSESTTMASAGTAAYMAPEQIRGESVRPATDVYALGVMLFEMLTGQRPFRGNEAGTEKGGETANERIRYAHLHIQPPDPRSRNPSISEKLAQSILSALDKDPSKRYLSTREFLEALCTTEGITISLVADRTTLPTELKETGSPTQPPAPMVPVNLPTTSGRMIPWLIGGVTLGVIVLVMGIRGGNTQAGEVETVSPVLTITDSQPPPSLTKTDTPVPSQTSTQFVTNPTSTEKSNEQQLSDPAEFGHWYFTAVWKDRNYQFLWDTYLTPSFRSNSSSYQDYADWWGSVDRIDINSVEVVQNDGKNAWISIDVDFYMKDGRILKNRKYDYDLLYDATNQTWMLD